MNRLFLSFWTVLSLSAQVATSHYDLAGTSSTNSETVLTPANITTGFGVLGTFTCDSSVMFAQPLVLASSAIAGHSHLLLVATLGATICAFDADLPGHAALWATALTPVNTTAAVGAQQNLYSASIGIVSTPAVDTVANIVYVVHFTSTPSYVITKLNFATGGVISNTTVSGTYSATTFNASQELQRPGLKLSGGNLYVAFGSQADTTAWHGWIMAYDATTMSKVGIFSPSPGSNGGGIWSDLTIDASGNVYATVGNGSVSGQPTLGQYNGTTIFTDSVLKLSSTLSLLDWFTPSNNVTLNANDEDVGANRLILIPGTNLLAATGAKDFNIYVLDTNCMGHLQGSSGCALQTFQTEATTASADTGAFGVAFLNNVLYVPNTDGHIYAYTWTGTAFDTTPLFSQTNSYGYPGAAQMAGSSSGTTNGILWVVTAASSAVTSAQSGTLRALNPVTGSEYWNSGTTLGNMAKFVPPVIANGKVYMATAGGNTIAYGIISSRVMDGQVTISGQVK